jgi:hypothetical protein
MVWFRDGGLGGEGEGLGVSYLPGGFAWGQGVC